MAEPRQTDDESSVGSGRRRVKGEGGKGRREGESQQKTERLSKKWEGNLYVANRFDFGCRLLGREHKRTRLELPCILRLVGRRVGQQDCASYRIIWNSTRLNRLWMERFNFSSRTWRASFFLPRVTPSAVCTALCMLHDLAHERVSPRTWPQ